MGNLKASLLREVCLHAHMFPQSSYTPMCSLTPVCMLQQSLLFNVHLFPQSCGPLICKGLVQSHR